MTVLELLHILSTTRAYLCVIAARHFLIDPHDIVTANVRFLHMFVLPCKYALTDIKLNCTVHQTSGLEAQKVEENRDLIIFLC